MTEQVIVAAVWLIERSTPTQRRELGAKLKAWQSKHGDVTGIHGLEQLLDGTYPEPFGTFHTTDSSADGAIPDPYPHFGLSARYIPEPWRDCPAVVFVGSPDISGYDIRASLKVAIPSSLGTVGFDMFLP